MKDLDFVRIVIENKNSSDEMLAKATEKAIKSGDKELMKKAASHPNASSKTLTLLAQI